MFVTLVEEYIDINSLLSNSRYDNKDLYINKRTKEKAR